MKGESIGSIILGILRFTTAPYSWCIKYYILLYLRIPLLNMLFKRSRPKKFILIGFLIGG